MRDRIFILVLIWSTIFFVWALAWTNPPGNPPTGGGALRVDEPTQEILFLPAAPARRVSVVGGDFRIAGGNLILGAAMPNISASGRIYIPGGIYVASTGNIETDGILFANGGIEDNGGPLVFSDEVQITPTLATQIPLTLSRNATGTIIAIKDNLDQAVATFLVSSKGEARSIDPTNSMTNRLWGQGRAGVGLINSAGECSVSGIKISRSDKVASWYTAGAVCPQSWWVCTESERGAGSCPSAGGDDYKHYDCTGTEKFSDYRYWVADGIPTGGFDFMAKAIGKAGDVFDRQVCGFRRVWCCAYQ